MGRYIENHEKGFHQHKQASKFDEYYTNKFEVKYLFEQVIDNEQLKGKIIYCCADGDESEFVKYLESHKKEIGYKEFIYTCDDFRTHEDLFRKADYVITNPPFSLNYELLDMLKKTDTRFFLFGSIGMLWKYVKIFSPNEVTYIRLFKRVSS